MSEISHSYTNEFIEILEEFKSIMELKGDVFRSKAYQTALESIMLNVYEITDPKIQLKLMKGIGNTIYNKLIEYVDTGKIESLINERKNPIIQFTTIYGIGPKKAQELISLGINSISELKLPENSCYLNDKQKIGLKYQKYINEKIPRNEINQYKKVFDKLIDTINKSICCDYKLQYEIVGSYRRGKDMSGDIDLIISNNSQNIISEERDNELFELFLNTLIKNKIIIEVLSKGKSKSLTICNLSNLNDKYIPRRIDFLYCPKKEYPFALLYFTGSKIFNTVMRQHAVDNGYTFNEHGIYYMKKGIKGKMIDNYDFIDEESIFSFLNLEYKNPNERIDGRSIISLSTFEKKNIQNSENNCQNMKKIENNLKGKSNEYNTNKKNSLDNTNSNKMNIDTMMIDIVNHDDLKEFPVLFGEASTGKIKQWSIKVYKDDDINSIIQVEHGYIDGKKQTNRKVINKGKNIGKKNETNSFQQAVLEANTQWIKKKENGYSELQSSSSGENVNVLLKSSDVVNGGSGGSGAGSTVVIDSLGGNKITNRGKGITNDVPSVMLAHDYNKRGKDIKYPCFIQRKFDGTRCVGIPQRGLFSRNKKEYPHLEHIISEINSIPSNIILDGELYSETLTFQEIVGIVKREILKGDDLKKQLNIKYYVYDIINDHPYFNRNNILKDLFNNNTFKYLSLVDTEICNNEQNMKEKHSEYVSDGYEGIMLRNKNGKYKGVRSCDLQKYKEFYDKEYEVVGYNEGQGLEDGCVIWVCKTENNKIFNCRPRGTRESRQEMFLNGDSYLGKMLTVRFQEETDDGVPRFPVGIAFRDYE